METSQIKYAGFSRCYECRIDYKRLVVVADIGPRILSLSINDGPNILFVNPASPPSENRWHQYGGHRLWIAPENNTTYAPDNDPCRVEETGGRITVTGYDAGLTLEKSMTVSENDGDFIVTHTVTNRGGTLFTGAIWALTCVVPRGVAFFPWGTGEAWDLKKVVYWHRWMNHSTTIKDPQFVPTDDLFMVRPTGEEGKVGTSGREGFIGVAASGYTFVKRFSRNPSAPYPDEDCAVQCYTCKDFVELETLGPLVTFFPDIPVSHEETWRLADTPVDPEDGTATRQVVFDQKQ